MKLFGGGMNFAVKLIFFEGPVNGRKSKLELKILRLSSGIEEYNPNTQEINIVERDINSNLDDEHIQLYIKDIGIFYLRQRKTDIEDRVNIEILENILDAINSYEIKLSILNTEIFEQSKVKINNFNIEITGDETNCLFKIIKS